MFSSSSGDGDGDGESVRKQARLRTVLDKLGRLMDDGARAQQTAMERADQERRALVDDRMALLGRERIPLTPEVRQRVVYGRSLRRTPSLFAAQRWLARADAPPILVLSGAPGSGKSVAAAAALCDASLIGRSRRWRSASALVRAFAGMFGEALHEQQLLADAHVLVIEDVGTESDDARMSSALVEVLEHRGKDVLQHRTILTTNLREDDFAQRYDARLVSRMSSRFCAWAYSAGADLRQP